MADEKRGGKIIVEYPHKVCAPENRTLQHASPAQCRFVFWSTDLGEWEAPASERLDPNKRYRMTLVFEEVQEHGRMSAWD